MSTGTKPGSRLGLSRERILSAALDLLDRDGLAAFSMRRLAEELGVGTMTVYGYFRSKEELLDALVDSGSRTIAEVASLAEGDGVWKARMRELMTALRRALLDHPAFVELRYRHPLQSPGALTITEVGLRILREAGFDKRQTAEIYRVLFVYTFGFAAFGPGRRSGADRADAIEALGALSADDYPVLVDTVEEATNSMADETLYEVGLDALLDGFEARSASVT
jgi:AcrR family transcriptional regulator